MNHEDKDLTKKLPSEPIDASQAHREFWEQIEDGSFHLPDFHRPFDGNLVDHSSNDWTDLLFWFLLAVSSFSLGWFLSAILTSNI